MQFRVSRQKLLFSHPELRADCGLPPGRAHLQRFISVSAADTFKEVVDEVEPAEGERESRRSVFSKRKQLISHKKMLKSS